MAVHVHQTVIDGIMRACRNNTAKPPEPLEQCLNRYLAIMQVLSPCPEPQPPSLVHSDRQTECDALERTAYRTVYPALLFFCWLGNVANLRIYGAKCFQGATAVQLLRAKALANLLFVSALGMEMAHAFSPDVPNLTAETLYWRSKPYMLAAANVGGTLSTWLTTIVTVNTVLSVSIPTQFKQVCGQRVIYGSMFLCMLSSCLLHATMPITLDVIRYREVESVPGCVSTRVTLRFVMAVRNGSGIYGTAQRAYYWVHSVTVIILPTLVMLVCSILLAANRRFKELARTFSGRRRCVIRLTTATAVAHLCLEGPAVLVTIAAALFGSNLQSHSSFVCKMNTVVLCMAVLNAAVPFFLYLACNERFRILCWHLLIRMRPDQPVLSATARATSPPLSKVRARFRSAPGFRMIQRETASEAPYANPLIQRDCASAAPAFQTSLTRPRSVVFDGRKLTPPVACSAV